MNIFNVRALGQRQKFKLAILAGFVASLVLGLFIGWIRYIGLDFSFMVWFVAYGIAFVIQKLGKGVQTRFSILGLAYAVLGILISDVVAVFGIARVLDFSAYHTVLRMALTEDIASMVWLLYRFVALYISYHYSRVI